MKIKINRTTLFIPFIILLGLICAGFYVGYINLHEVTKIVENCPIQTGGMMKVSLINVSCEISTKPDEMSLTLECMGAVFVLLITFIISSLLCEKYLKQ